MYTIRTLNNIAKTGLAKLPEQNFVIDEKAENSHFCGSWN